MWRRALGKISWLINVFTEYTVPMFIFSFVERIFNKVCTWIDFLCQIWVSEYIFFFFKEVVQTKVCIPGIHESLASGGGAAGAGGAERHRKWRARVDLRPIERLFVLKWNTQVFHYAQQCIVKGFKLFSRLKIIKSEFDCVGRVTCF